MKKLEYDLDRVLKSPQDQYAAFDFFVTAEHIVDWIHPDDRKARESVRSGSSLLITSHLANGVKHFEVKAVHHQSVADVEKSRYVKGRVCRRGVLRRSPNRSSHYRRTKFLWAKQHRGRRSRKTGLRVLEVHRGIPAVERTCAKSAQAANFTFDAQSSCVRPKSSSHMC